MNKKRNLFDEIMSGFEALKDERAGKITLKRVKFEPIGWLTMSASEIKKVRKKLNVSRAVFARLIRTPPRTIEAWEQGRCVPNQQALTLLKLVDKYPETIKQIEKL